MGWTLSRGGVAMMHSGRGGQHLGCDRGTIGVESLYNRDSRAANLQFMCGVGRGGNAIEPLISLRQKAAGAAERTEPSVARPEEPQSLRLTTRSHTGPPVRIESHGIPDQAIIQNIYH